MRNLEVKKLESEIKEVVDSLNIKYVLNRRIPEKSIKVDYFLYTDKPTIIETISLSYRYIDRIDILISRLLSLKLVNSGHIRLIPIFLKSPRISEKRIYKRILNNEILNKIVDGFIIINLDQGEANSMYLTIEIQEKLKKLISKPIKVDDIIKQVSIFSRFYISPLRVNFLLKNIGTYRGFYPLIQSFYYYYFDETFKSIFKEKFIENWDNYINRPADHIGRRYSKLHDDTSGEKVFRLNFGVQGWNYEDPELKLLLLNFRRNLEGIIRRRRFPFYFNPNDPIIKDFLKEMLDIENQSKNNLIDYNNIFGGNYYKTFKKDHQIYLLIYCLKNSNFRNFFPINILDIGNIKFEYFLKIKTDWTIYIFHQISLPDFLKSIFSITYFGKLIKHEYKSDVELICFLNVQNYEEEFSKNENLKKKGELLEENGWKIYPFQNYYENITLLNNILTNWGKNESGK